MNYKLQYFNNEIDLKKLKESYDGYIEDKEINLSLNFITDKIKKSKLDEVNLFLSNLEAQHKKNLAYIANNYNDKTGVVSHYINEMLDYLSDDKLSELIDKGSEKRNEEQLLEKIILTSVIIYPIPDENGFGNYATFDYKLGVYDQYVLVLRTDEKGEVIYINTES